jgi:maleylacetoacetate isomerase/maleylpyruvate isomerase
MEGEMRFYGYFRSSSSYRCRIAFGLKGLAPEFVPVHLRRDGGQQHTPAYRAINPQGQVPALEVDGRILTQSPAILEWLEETHPAPPLLPADPFERAAVRAFCAVIACDIQPLHNLRVLNHLGTALGQDQDGKAAWCRRWIEAGLAACEALLAGRPATTFAFGDSPGMAEVYLIPQMFAADRFGADLAPMPRLRAIRAAAEALPAFAAAHPRVQPDAE